MGGGCITTRATPTPGKTLLSPADHTLIMIDHQSQMAFATRSIDTTLLRNNVGLVAHSARIFGVSTILTTVAEKSFSGPMFDEIKAALPELAAIDRTSMNTWEDANIARRVNEIGKGRIVFAGLWTSVCIVGPALSALDQGFVVYVIAGACGDIIKPPTPEKGGRLMLTLAITAGVLALALVGVLILAFVTGVF